MPSLRHLAHAAAPANLAVAGWLAAAAVAVAVYVAQPAGSIAQDVVFSLIGFGSVGVMVVGTTRNRPARPAPWWILAVAQFLFVAGDALFAVLAQLGETPFPSIADVAYLAGYPLLVVAFLQVTWIRVRGGDWTGLIDGATLAAAAAIIGWGLLVAPALAAADPDPLGLAVSGAYPLADLLVMGVVIGLLATPGARTPSFALLVGSLALLLLADVGYAAATAAGTYAPGGLLDVLWASSYALIGAAALHRSMRRVAAPHPVEVAWLTRTRLAMLAAATLAGPALLIAADGEMGRDAPYRIAASAAVSLFVILRLAGVVGTLARDNAERRRLEAELSHRASHDALTGLSNRHAFAEHLDAALATGDRFSVLFLDLDDFKTVNDTLGHSAGDALLEEVADRIRDVVRGDDIVARLGGDEFAILTTRVQAERAAEVAQRIIEAVEAPFTWEGNDIRVGASVGVVDPERASRDASELMRAADVAMYGAKALGKGRAQLYDPASLPVAVLPPARGGAQADGRPTAAEPPILARGSLTTVTPATSVRPPTRPVAPASPAPSARAAAPGS